MMYIMSNPLLEEFELPTFSSIKAGDIEPAIDATLARNRDEISALLEGKESAYNWSNLVHPMELIVGRQ